MLPYQLNRCEECRDEQSRHQQQLSQKICSKDRDAFDNFLILLVVERKLRGVQPLRRELDFEISFLC